MNEGQTNHPETRNTFAQTETGIRLPKTSEEVVDQYARGDFNQRMGLWLEHRDLRGAFDVVEQASPAWPSKSKGRLHWLCLGRKKPPIPSKRHYAA